MTDTITRQVSEPIKRAMEAANSTRPFPHFDYVPTNRCEPSHRQERVPSPYYTEREREVLTIEQGSRITVSGKEALQFASPHNKPLVIKMKIASAIMRSPDISIQGVSYLIPCTITLTGRRKKLHLLGVSVLVVGPLTLVDVVEYWVASPSILWHSAVALTPQANSSFIVTSSSIILGGSEVPKVVKSQDLTKSWISESLATGSALIKVDGRWALGGELLTAYEVIPTVLEGAVCSWGLRVWSLADRLPECQGVDCSAPASPAWVRADAAVSSRRPLALPLLFRTVLGIGCHLLRSSVPDLKDRQPRPRLLCIKQKRSQGWPIPQEKFLRIKRPDAAKKKSFSKNFNLGSQFKRSMPLNLALHRFYCLSHKLGDRSGLIILPYVELEAIFLSSAVGSPKGFLTGLPSFHSGIFPQPDSWKTKRKLYFQYFTFDFFSMAVMNLNVLLKQYHPKYPVSLGALWTIYTRLNARAEQVRPHSSQVMIKEQMLCHDVGTTGAGASSYLFKISSITGEFEIVVEYRAINCYTFGMGLVHGCIGLGDYEGIPCRQEGRESDCLDHPMGPSRLGPSGTLSHRRTAFPFKCQLARSRRPFVGQGARRCPLRGRMSRQPIRRGGGGPPEVELVLVEEATSAPGFNELGAKKGLSYAPSADYSSGDLMRGVDLVFAILHLHLRTKDAKGRGMLRARPQGSARFKKRHRVGNLFRFPTLILSGDAHSARNILLHNLVHNHDVEDRLQHLGDIRVLSTLYSYAKVETPIEDKVILREGPRMLS
ncbi:LOW QUALITY PROTEIN: hypothetical protein Cgig2_027463 [Carnegiea gigantea]|uniref:Uncharacterized protein n=1 Tax=Carnegiea gigantea TaxID=171969 RepID=A0A9Q1KL77_9CARY|nr:LOW QUALITY PROTEIN: hypothetical protein Cgig2_027463 [Carnegiea gigantea]